MSPDHSLTAGAIVTFDFLNHRGETEMRRIIFRALTFGTSPHFPDTKDWFIRGLCLTKGEERSFRLANVTLLGVQ